MRPVWVQVFFSGNPVRDCIYGQSQLALGVFDALAFTAVTTYILITQTLIVHVDKKYINKKFFYRTQHRIRPDGHQKDLAHH